MIDSKIHQIDSLSPEDVGGSQKTWWKVEKVRQVLSIYNEPMLNLHFFNPFIKEPSGVFSYSIIMKYFETSTEKKNVEFLN